MRDAESPTRLAASVGCSPRWRASANIVLAVPTASSNCAPGDLGAEPDLERLGQDLERPQLGRDDVGAAVLDAAAGPASRACPAAPPSPPASARSRRSRRSLLEPAARRAASSGTGSRSGDGLLAEEEVPLLHEAASGTTGPELPGFSSRTSGRSWYFRAGFGAAIGRTCEADRGLAGRRAGRRRGQGRGDEDECESSRELPASSAGAWPVITSGR